MHELLLHYYLRLYEVLVLCVLAAGAITVTVLIIRRRYQNKFNALRESLAQEYQSLPGKVEQTIAHRWRQHMVFVKNRSTETLQALTEDQDALRIKQALIRAKANELDRQAKNTMLAFDPKDPIVRPELLSVTRLLNSVLGGFYDYVDDRQVALRPSLSTMEPTLLDRALTVEVYENVIHNAIKYSCQGGVVEVNLALTDDTKNKNQKMICLRVSNTGKVIPEKEREAIFGEGITASVHLERGHGLGLYIAKKYAILQGGDVVLVRSNSQEGTVFQVTLPYTEMIALDE